MTKASKLSIGIIVICIINFILLGCNKQEAQKLPNEYVLGKDSTTFMYREAFCSTFITNCENGYYCILNGYVYFSDNTMKTIILCNKPNCLHNQETNEILKKECNAYVGNIDGTERWIQYYDGYIYTASLNTEDFSKDIVKISSDGSKREIISKYNNVHRPILLHRGYIYFIQEANGSQYEGTIKKNYSLVRMSVNNKSAEYEKIYLGELEEGNIYSLLAYGKNIYFYESGYEIKTNVETMKEYKERWIVYNRDTGGFSEVGNSDRKECILDRIVFDRDKIIYSYWYYSYEDIRNGKIFSSELDGSNEKEIADTKNCKNYIASDNNYYYFDNILESDVENYDENAERIIEIYNKDMEKIDNFTIGKLEFKIIGYGDDNYLFYYQVTNDEKQIYYIDKKEFGTGDIHSKLLITVKY